MQAQVRRTLAIGLLLAASGLGVAAHAAEPSTETPAPKRAAAKAAAAGKNVVDKKAGEAERIKARKELDVVYATADGIPLKLDLYFPEKQSDTPAPLVVYIHGGGWKNGTKTGGGWLSDVANALIAKGYVVGSIEYRLFPTGNWPSYIYDVKAGIRFLRANAAKYNVDPKHIGVWGGSAGGHLVALLGTSDANDKLEGDLGHADQSSRVQAVVDMFGPSDFSLWPQAPAEPLPQFASFDNYKAASPVTYVTKDDPPFLILQGDSDTLVPQVHSEKLNEKLKAAGVESTLVLVKNGKHGLNTPDIQPTKAEMIDMMVKFYDKHLKPAGAEKPAAAAAK